MLDCSMNNKWNILNISKLLCFGKQDMLIHISLTLVTSWFSRKSQFSVSKLSISVSQRRCVLQINCYSSVTVLLSICNNVLNFRKRHHMLKVIVPMFGHVMHRRFPVHSRWTDVVWSDSNIICALSRDQQSTWNSQQQFGKSREKLVPVQSKD